VPEVTLLTGYDATDCLLEDKEPFDGEPEVEEDWLLFTPIDLITLTGAFSRGAGGSGRGLAPVR